MKRKKIPYYMLVGIFTIGASLTLGLLSFGGMFVLWPFFLVAGAAFLLSVAYEGEIYQRNIRGALNKLFFKNNYIAQHLANEYLTKYFPDPDHPDCPQFFKDYAKDLKDLEDYAGQGLSKKDAKKKKFLKKSLRHRDKWFAKLMLKTDLPTEGYESDVLTWVNQQEMTKQLWLAQLAKRRFQFHGAKIVSVGAAIFMIIGNSYLLVDIFTVLPVLSMLPFAMLPFFIVPMSIVAGIAYGLLIYNAVTDMINNDTFKKWFTKLRDALAQGITFRSVFMTVAAVVLVAIAVALTVCTAGTWWTIAQKAQPLFAWMAKIPSFVIGIIHPIITGGSSLVFNLENTSESLELIDEQLQHREGPYTRIKNKISESWKKFCDRENWLQRVNPARILLKLTFTPLRIVFFLAHLVSIGVTGDRMPGMPAVASALLGFLGEFFEDVHIFFGEDAHGHEIIIRSQLSEHEYVKKLINQRFEGHHGHNHNNDIPTRALRALFIPLFLLAALWDYWASQKHDDPSKRLNSFKEAWTHMRGGSKPQRAADALSPDIEPTKPWQVHRAIHCIQRFKEKELQGVLFGKQDAQEKIDALGGLESKLRSNQSEDIAQVIRDYAQNSLHKELNTNGFFSKSKVTSEFLEKLPKMISAPA